MILPFVENKFTNQRPFLKNLLRHVTTHRHRMILCNSDVILIVIYFQIKTNTRKIRGKSDP